MIPALKILLVGSTGTGKTTSIKTFIDAGITPMCIFTELGYGAALGSTDPKHLHWVEVPAAVESLESLASKTNALMTMDTSALAKMQDVNRHRATNMMKFVKTLNQFKCERTDEDFGPVASWGPDRVLVIDSLSGLIEMAWIAIIGAKPLRDKPDYGKVQELVGSQIKWLCHALKCHILLTAHVDRTFNEITNETLLTPALPGKAMISTFGMYWDEILMSLRKGSEFMWSNSVSGADLKARYLPLGTFKPHFGQIIEAWKVKGGGL